MRRTDKIALGVLAAVVIGGLLALLLEALYQQYFTPAFAPCPATAGADEIPDGSRVARAAKPFAGPGPHPLVVVGVTGREQRELEGTELPGLPATALAARDTDGRPAGAQLVVCRFKLADPPVPIGNCSYQDQNKQSTAVPMVASRYAYQVRQAASGGLVEQFELSATGGQCPLLHLVDQPTVAMLPSGDDVWRRLKPLVTAPR